jgi:hypothetical protein
MERQVSGSLFEEMVYDLFFPIQREYPYRFRITKHPRLILQTGEMVIPDFEIEIDLPHLNTKHLIECQDRNKNSKAILHKIQHIRSKSNRNKFIFVYRKSASGETLKSLSLEGVLVFSFEQLVQFAQQVELIIGATKPAEFGGGDCGWDAEGECEEE